jgi:DAK2 domain fusion protein YloV
MPRNKHWMSGAIPFIHLIAAAIDQEKVTINNLNLFPVADGDTGTNLATTLTKMAGDITKMPRRSTPKELLQAFARSANMRARGNSGTILAAIITGIVETLEDAEQLTPELMATALENANAKARSVVKEPTEGTMLTVVQDMAYAARTACNNGATELGDLTKPILMAAMNATEQSAAVMRQVLGKKDVGQDAGAFGLSIIVRAAIKSITKDLDDIDFGLKAINPETTVLATTDDNYNWRPGTPLYCTEFVLHPHAQPAKNDVNDFLSSIGDCGLYSAYEDVAKVHVHTNTPWEVLKWFSKIGELSDVEIHNMRIQTEEHQAAIRLSAPQNALGIVAVGAGDGVKDLLAQAGVNVIVDGGQTNNPEVGEIYQAILEVDAATVIVLPGNKNVILAAEQACNLAKSQNITGITIPTKNLPQTVAALLAIEDIDKTDDPSTIEAQLTAAATSTKSACVTAAVKDYDNDLTHAVAGDSIVLIDDDIVYSGCNVISAIVEAVRLLDGEAAEFITIYLGSDFTASEKCLRKKLDVYPNAEITLVHGGQPVYPAIISVE